MACPDDVSAKAEKEPKLVMGDPGPVAVAGGTVRSVGSAWRQLVPDLRGHRPTDCTVHRRARRYFARETSPLNVRLFIPEGNKLT